MVGILLSPDGFKYAESMNLEEQGNEFDQCDGKKDEISKNSKINK